MRCDNCRYWRKRKRNYQQHPDDMVGICRRFPPVLDVGFILTQYFVHEAIEFQTVESPSYWQQPINYGSGYCGEWVIIQEV
jgi:hypothetical protein